MFFLNLIILLFSIILGLYFTLFVSNKFNLFDHPNKNKVHLNKTPNIGGLAIIFSLFTSFIIYDYSSEKNIIFILSIIIIIIGFVDDLINFNALSKLFLISIPVTIFVHYISNIETLGSFFGYNINLGNYGFIFTFMCMLLLINATNYMDGIDGLISLLAIISFTGIMLLIPVKEWSTLIPIICFLIVFLFFNFGILPKQFLGDSGSLGIGFLLSSFAIYYTQVIKYINPTIIIWFLSFYVFEFLTINIIRLKNKKNPFEKDLNFIFNILQNKFGKFKTITLCCLLNNYLFIHGFILNFFELYNYSILIFIIYFIIYLSFRIKYSEKTIN